MSKNTSRSLLSIAICAMTILTGSFLAGCTNENDPESDGNHRHEKGPQPKVYTYKLSFGGDYIDQSEEPLFRADNPATYVGINVTRKAKDNPDTESENYAYGMFLDQTSMSIDLESGYLYNFEATLISDRTDEYIQYNTSSFDAPFRFQQIGQSSTDKLQFQRSLINKFQYNTNPSVKPELKGYFCELSKGKAKIKHSDQTDLMIVPTPRCLFPRINRFYGTKEYVDPQSLSSTAPSIEIPLAYKCFGIKINVSNMPEDTYLTVKDITKRSSDTEANSNLFFPANLHISTDKELGTSVWEDVYSMYNLSEDNKETFKLHFTLYSTVLGKSIAQFDEEIEVRAKYKKVLTASVIGEVNTLVSGNIILQLDNTDLTEESSEPSNWEIK